MTAGQMDRACGVLLGSAWGDALGAGYEFTKPAPDLIPQLIGGGLGNFAPGQWTDDTDQAVAIARVAATGVDLRTSAALDDIAAGFLDWFHSRPADIGVQTRMVFSQAATTPTSVGMRAAALAVHERAGRSAGNGSLMRTGPVALAYLDDPQALVEAAMLISSLTHYQDVAQEACAVWCLMIRHTVLTGDFPTFDDIAPWVPNGQAWRGLLAEAEAKDPSTFARNGWSVGALQAAWSAITHTPTPTEDFPSRHMEDSLATAIRIGHDTDTVAAIAGALLGAKWGMSAIPAAARRLLHGWPGMTATDLEHLAVLTVRGGRPLSNGWPGIDALTYDAWQQSGQGLVRHPHDDGVWMGGISGLKDLPKGTGAVLSLCLTGGAQVPPEVEHITYRLMDEPEPDSNPNLDFLLIDAAQTLAALRAEGKQVVLHCVAAHSRTPTVGIAYAMLLGIPLPEARDAVCSALPSTHINSGFRRALQRIEPRLHA